MTLKQAKENLKEAIDALIESAQAERDRQWRDALAEPDTPLFGGARLLPFVPKSPEEVPDLLRQIEALLKPNPATRRSKGTKS